MVSKGWWVDVVSGAMRQRSAKIPAAEVPIVRTEEQSRHCSRAKEPVFMMIIMNTYIHDGYHE